MATDCFGKSLQLGDTIAWTGAKFSGPVQAEVIGFTPERIKIRETVRREWDRMTHLVQSSTIVRLEKGPRLDEHSSTLKDAQDKFLHEGDKVACMYTGHCRAFPGMYTGKVKAVGKCLVTVWVDLEKFPRYFGRVEKASGKVYITLDPTRVCRID